MDAEQANAVEMPSGLARRLRSGAFAITAEVTPPLSTDRRSLLAKAMPLKGLADAVNVTDGASARAHMCAPIAAAILAEADIEPILQLTCRDRNRIALESDILGASALGVRNLLVLTGDDPSAGDQPETKPVFDLKSSDLIRIAAVMRDKGELPSGRAIEGRPPLLLGAADMPIDPPSGWRPTSLRDKIAAGVEFVQTQFCMDTAILRRYLERLANEGVIPDLAVLVGIAPLASARSAIWIRTHLHGSIIPDVVVRRLEQATDPRAEGKRICIELLQELASIKGVAGAHIMAPLNEAAIPEVIGALDRPALARA